jgi:protein TonB
MKLRDPRLTGLGASALGTALVLGLVLFMNRPFEQPEGEDGNAFSSIEVVKREKPPAAEPVRRPEPPRRPPQRSAPAPIVGNDILGDSGDVVMTDDTVDVAPRPIVQTPMTYPPRARAQGVTGYVLLSVLIGPTGQVERVKVLEAQPAGVFDDVAVAGVQTWKFEPATYRGENVRVWATQRVRFNLS